MFGWADLTFVLVTIEKKPSPNRSCIFIAYDFPYVEK
jgi:hypothetical protein